MRIKAAKGLGNLVGILLLLYFGVNFIIFFPPNFKRVEAIKAWFNIKPVGLIRSDNLQDDFPDGWEIESWGNSTQIIRIAKEDAYQGRNAALIQRTNTNGGTALTQTVQVEPGQTLVISFYEKGSGGALQLLFRDLKGKWLTPGSGGWLSFPAYKDWTQVKLQVTVPPNVKNLKLLLRTKEKSLFDDIYLGVLQNGIPGPDLLKNSGFEQDGFNEDPLVWWQNATQIRELPVVDGENSNSLSFLSISDMSRSRFMKIEQRAQDLGDDCAFTPEMTAWLMALGHNFEEVGGAAARERLYQLSVRLAPNCPQPYAALGELYETHKAYESAAHYYQLAAEKYLSTPLAGKYYFSEGLLLLRNMGDLQNAIHSFEKAEHYQGWERGIWYQGAATFFLGSALEQSGKIPEAIQAYERVAGCQSCSVQAVQANERLNALKNPD